MNFRSAASTLAWTSLLLVGGLTTEAMAIVVAPTAIYLTSDDRAAVIQLYNPSTQPEEVSVEAIFGYPATDEEGRIGLRMSEEGDPRSAADWVQVLPRRLVVPPGQRRAVRLLARPPLELRDGEYWTRLIFTSRGQSVPVTGMDTTELVAHLWLADRRVGEVSVDELGNLVVPNLKPGSYELILSGPEVEVHIRDLDVGVG